MIDPVDLYTVWVTKWQ